MARIAPGGSSTERQRNQSAPITRFVTAHRDYFSRHTHSSIGRHIPNSQLALFTHRSKQNRSGKGRCSQAVAGGVMQVRQPRASFAPNASEAAIAEPRKTTRINLGLIRMFPSLNRIESRLFVSTRLVRCNRHGSGAALYKPWRTWAFTYGTTIIALPPRSCHHCVLALGF